MGQLVVYIDPCCTTTSCPQCHISYIVVSSHPHLFDIHCESKKTNDIFR